MIEGHLYYVGNSLRQRYI